MDVKYINPFLLATSDIVNQVLGVAPVFEKPFIKTTPYSNAEELLVIIGVTGEMNGKVLINIGKESCINIASQMMGGMPVEFNELSKSAVSELCNMILGTSATHFASQGMSVNITSPTVLEGHNITVSQKEQVICIPINVGNEIKITVNISTERKAA
ncbi:MAG: chemotaxis protein CheX [Peptococcaceae bacterium]